MLVVVQLKNLVSIFLYVTNAVLNSVIVAVQKENNVQNVGKDI